MNIFLRSFDISVAAPQLVLNRPGLKPSTYLLLISDTYVRSKGNGCGKFRVGLGILGAVPSAAV